MREPIEVGRECTGVVLNDPRVSRRHLVLAPTDGGGRAEVAVLDLGSLNGTLLAGVRLTSEAILRPGNEIRLGDTTIAVVLERADAVPAEAVPLDEVATPTTVLPAQHDRPAATPADAWRRPELEPGRGPREAGRSDEWG